MAQLSEKFLSWLYSSLHEYYDPQRTYSDIVKALNAFPQSISPKTENYAYENGAEALLLSVTGTIPVAFRGTTYRFPIKLWIPHRYPQEPPFVYVNPGKDMLVKPGQHVGVDGRVYHPYLRDWSRMWDHAGIADFLRILQQVFAKEPPVLSKTQQQQYQRPLSQTPQPIAPSGPPPPQLPPKQHFASPPVEMPGTNTPPPRPPKPGEEYASTARDVARNGPPLPPLPREMTPNLRYTSPYQQQTTDMRAHQPQIYHSPPPGYSNGSLPRVPTVTPLPNQQLQQPQHYRINQDRSPVSPLSPVNGFSEMPENRYAQAPTLTQPPVQQQYTAQPPTPSAGPPQHPYQPSFPHAPIHPYAPSQAAPLQTLPQQAPQTQKPPPPDLLSDPFDIALPSLDAVNISAAAPPPPIPPNPEKEHLLHAISTTLVQQAQSKVNQNLSAMAPLQAQHSALYAAHDRLEAEIRQLEQLDQALSRNEAILRGSIQDCDRTIETAKSKKQPSIDEVLVAPTMVANQLWTLCAEEAACREAMYLLQKAVDRGRISGNDFVRQMRGLGRECFLNMALARKCAKGMGLDVPRLSNTEIDSLPRR